MNGSNQISVLIVQHEDDLDSPDDLIGEATTELRKRAHSKGLEFRTEDVRFLGEESTDNGGVWNPQMIGFRYQVEAFRPTD